MLFIMGSTFFFTCLLAGWAALCVRYVRFETDNPWLYPFLGMFAAGTVFSAVSLCSSINTTALAVFIFIGLLGFPQFVRALRTWHSKHSSGESIVFWVFVLSCTAIAAAGCAYVEWPARAYDTDLYHANAVRWLNEYGTPPGLANLHLRLGMHSIWLLLAGLFDNAFWDNRTAWVMNNLLLFSTVAYLSSNILFSAKRTVRIFCSAMLVFIFITGVRKIVPNLYYDISALWISMLVFAECLIRAEDGSKVTPGQASVILSLAALAFAIKPVAGMVVLFSVFASVYGIKQKTHKLFGPLCATFSPAIVAGIIWVARNSLLSGYPLFPLPILPLPLDWTPPKETVAAFYDVIVSWARQAGADPSSTLNTLSWIVPWLQRKSISGTFWAFAGLPLLAGVFLWVKVLRRKTEAMPLFFCLWVVCCLVYWFVTAPDTRFGMTFFQIFFALGLAFNLRQTAWLADHRISFHNIMQSKRSSILISACILLVTVSINIWQIHSAKGKISFFQVGTIPARALYSRELDASVTPPILLFSPVQDQCGNSPLPCTPDDSRNLSLRVRGNLGGGFHSR